MLSIVELLKPRKKVIAPYPHSSFTVGDILYQCDNKEWYGVKDAETHGYDDTIHIGWIEKCPNIFKELFWWEDRKESDMPEYVKFPDQFKKGKFNVIKIGEEYRHGFDDHPFLKNGDAEYFGLRQIKGAGGIYRSQLLPATKEEYESQK